MRENSISENNSSLFTLNLNSRKKSKNVFNKVTNLN